MAIHSTALVAADASLAPDVEVGAYSVIGAGVTIAAGTWVGPHAVIEGPTAIGRDNRIFQFASIGAAPQDLKYRGEPTRLEIRHRHRPGAPLERERRRGARSRAGASRQGGQEAPPQADKRHARGHRRGAVL